MIEMNGDRVVRIGVRGGATAVVLALLAGTIVLGASPAQADCASSSFAARARGADAVFVGTVQAKAGASVDVRVSDVYKGRVQARVRVDGGAAGAEDGAAFEPQTQYLFVAEGSGRRVRTNACLGSTQVSDAVISAAEATLGAPQSFRNPDAAQSSAAPSAPASTATATASPAPASRANNQASASSSNDAAEIVLGLVLLVLLLVALALPVVRRRRREARSTADEA